MYLHTFLEEEARRCQREAQDARTKAVGPRTGHYDYLHLSNSARISNTHAEDCLKLRRSTENVVLTAEQVDNVRTALLALFAVRADGKSHDVLFGGTLRLLQALNEVV